MNNKPIDDLFIASTAGALSTYDSSAVPICGDNGVMIELRVDTSGGGLDTPGINLQSAWVEIRHGGSRPNMKGSIMRVALLIVLGLVSGCETEEEHVPCGEECSLCWVCSNERELCIGIAGEECDGLTGLDGCECVSKPGDECRLVHGRYVLFINTPCS